MLLKLRFLASRLGSDVLEEWVKHEADGYPAGLEVPEYRKIGVSYIGTFFGPAGASIQNAPIPPYLVEQFAGKQWTRCEIRQSVASVESLVGAETKDPGGTLEIEAANLMLLLQGKVYPGYGCNSVTGRVPKPALIELLNAVRNRVLELTMEIEKSIPRSTEIALGRPIAPPPSREKEIIAQITQQIVYGNFTNISATGDHTNIRMNVSQGDRATLVDALIREGIPTSDAAELAEILASEEPESREEPFGKKAKAWIAKNIGKAVDGTWKVGVSVATKVLTEAALHYYGLK